MLYINFQVGKEKTCSHRSLVFSAECSRQIQHLWKRIKFKVYVAPSPKSFGPLFFVFMLLTMTLFMVFKNGNIVDKQKKYQQNTTSSSSLTGENPEFFTVETVHAENSSNYYSKKNISMKKVVIAGCKCAKVIRTSFSDASNSPISASTCSKSAFERGPSQKIFSLTYFGNPFHPSIRKYFQGLELNAIAINSLFPGWMVRIYHNMTEDSPGMDKMCALTCKFSNVDLCNVNNIPLLGDVSKSLIPTLWRFLPVVDYQVSVINSRDADSVVMGREQVAVQAWLRSKHQFHVMRDHPEHNVPMLAGMWGAKLDNNRDNWKEILKPMMEISAAYKTTSSGDQYLLEKYVWSWARDSVMQHDSYYCKLFSKTSPWPTRRSDGPNNYVGSSFALNTTISSPCPIRCRPKSHKNWAYC